MTRRKLITVARLMRACAISAMLAAVEEARGRRSEAERHAVNAIWDAATALAVLASSGEPE